MTCWLWKHHFWSNSVESHAQQRRDFCTRKYSKLLKHSGCCSQYFQSSRGQLLWSNEFHPQNLTLQQKNEYHQTTLSSISNASNTSSLSLLSSLSFSRTSAAKPTPTQSEQNNFAATSVSKSLPRGVIVFTHGFGMNNLLQLEAFIYKALEQNYAVYAPDLFGHGLSDGAHTHWSNAEQLWNHYQEYLLYVHSRLLSQYAHVLTTSISSSVWTVPMIEMGFSIGATLSLTCPNLDRLPFKFRAHVYLAPFHYSHWTTWLQQCACITLSSCWWSYSNGIKALLVRWLPRLVSALARLDQSAQRYDIQLIDPSCTHAYQQCEAVYSGMPSFATCYTMHQMHSQLEYLIRTHSIKGENLLLLHGTHDPVVSIQHSQRLLHSAHIEQHKELIALDNVRHSLVYGNTPQTQQEIYSKVFDWLNANAC